MEVKQVDKIEEKRAKMDQDIYKPVHESELRSTATMFMIFVGMWVSMYSVNLGVGVGQNTSVTTGVLGTFLGYTIAGVYAALLGYIGVKTRMSSYVVTKGAAGTMGQIILALLVFVSTGVGSVGSQADLVGRAVCGTTGLAYTPIISAIVCIVMMTSAVMGIKYMGIVSWVTMPLFFVLCIAATITTVGNNGGLASVLAIKREGGYSLSYVTFLNAGAWAGFVSLMPDVSRFLKSTKSVFSVASAFVIGAIPPICGVLLGASINASIDTAFVQSGMAIIGLIAIFGIGWTTNDNNAYTAGLALTTLLYPFKKIERWKNTVIVGIIGAFGALLGFGSVSFVTFLSAFRGYVNLALVGVLLAHYLVVSRGKKGFVQANGIAGVGAWMISGSLTYLGVLPIPVVTNTCLAFALYLVLYYGIEKRFFGENVVEKISPPKRSGVFYGKSA